MVFTTFWVEHRIWGLNPLGYHLVNLAFHGMSVVLLWTLLRRLSIRGAWLAAALFAAHPVMVESVVWVTELKNVQSGFFGLLALLVFLRWRPLGESGAATGPRGAGRVYVLSLVLFAAALLSKPVVVAMVPAILVLIWWKHGRIRRADLLAVAPMLVMGLAAGFVAMYVERQFGGASGSAWQLGWIERVLVAGRAVWFYAAALMWPAGLLPIYPRWDVHAGSWWQFVFPAGALAVLAALWVFRGRIGRGPLAAVTCFGLLVSPLVGIFNVSYDLYSFVADHFQYHAAPALFALFGSGVAAWRQRLAGRVAANLVSAGAAVALVVLAVIAQQHTQVFRNERARCEATLAGNPACWVAMNNLGVALNAEGQPREAVEWYRQALAVRPVYPEAHNNMGVALRATGDLRGAVHHYGEALRLWPGYALAHSNRATALAEAGHTAEAVQAYREALAINPDNADAHNSVAKVLASAGRTGRGGARTPGGIAPRPAECRRAPRARRDAGGRRPVPGSHRRVRHGAANQSG